MITGQQNITYYEGCLEKDEGTVLHSNTAFTTYPVTAITL